MTKAEQQLRDEIEELKNQIRELTETLEAISSGEVDAIVVTKSDEKKVYTLDNADLPYRILIENIREGALTLSREGMILYGNSAFSDMRGVPLESLIGTNLREHICPRDKDSFDHLLHDALSQPVRCEMSICSPDGSFPVQVALTSLNLDGSLKISAVVSDRRKDYERLQLQGRMLDSVADAVIAADPAGKIIYWNNAAAKIYGFSREEAIGQDLVSVTVPEMSTEESRKILGRLMRGKSWSGEYMVKHRDGHLFPIYANDSPVFDDDGRLIAVLEASHDISDQMRTEKELRQKNEDLNAANEEITSTQEELIQTIDELSRRQVDLNEALAEKDVLLSEIHHRVKNNLTAFISLLSLETAYDDSPTGLALKKDLQNRARSMALIHETLYRTKNYSRVNMDVYLSTLVGQVVRSFELAKSVKTVVDAHGITLDLSRATPGGLIINELMTNSLKYAFPASFDCETIRSAPCTIGVSLTQDDGAYLLTVRDNGIGLPEDLDVGTTKTLGLKLVNFLAKHQLRSSIEIRSDNGAEFRFRFRDKK
jgi:PAS domain S-box-containing protein